MPTSKVSCFWETVRRVSWTRSSARALSATISEKPAFQSGHELEKSGPLVKAYTSSVWPIFSDEGGRSSFENEWKREADLLAREKYHKQQRDLGAPPVTRVFATRAFFFKARRESDVDEHPRSMSNEVLRKKAKRPGELFLSPPAKPLFS